MLSQSTIALQPSQVAHVMSRSNTWVAKSNWAVNEPLDERVNDAMFGMMMNL